MTRLRASLLLLFPLWGCVGGGDEKPLADDTGGADADTDTDTDSDTDADADTDTDTVTDTTDSEVDTDSGGTDTGPIVRETETADAILMGDVPTGRDPGVGISWPAYAADIDGDGLGDLLVPHEGVGGLDATYVLTGTPVGSVAVTDVADYVLERNSVYRQLPRDTADYDGDGWIDVAFHATDEDWKSGGAGLFVVPGPISGEVSSEVALTEWYGEYAWYLGAATCSGDLDGDGADELLLGAAGWSDANDHGGAVFAIGKNALGTIDEAAADIRVTFPGEDEAAFGGEVAVWDMNGDGAVDLVVSAKRSYSDLGAVFAFNGPLMGDLTTDEADARIQGTTTGGLFGANMGVGDLDGDGIGDLAVGSAGDDTAGEDAGKAWVLTGPFTVSSSATDAVAEVLGTAPDEWLGPLGVADLNEDGVSDLALGAAGWEREPPLDTHGRVAVFLSLPRGTLTQADADARIESTSVQRPIGAEIRFGGLGLEAGLSLLVNGDYDTAGVIYVFGPGWLP